MQTSPSLPKTDSASLPGTLHYLLDGNSPMHRPSDRSIRDGRLSVRRPAMRLRDLTRVGILHLRMCKHYPFRGLARRISPW